MLHAFGHRVAMCCDILGVVGSSLKIAKFAPATPNMSQYGGQMHTTCYTQQCCNILRWHVVIIWPGPFVALIVLASIFSVAMKKLCTPKK